MKMPILEALGSGNVLLSDGAWGTFLHKRGLAAGECPELWNLTHEDVVAAIAASYIDAGSDVILTNSFGGSAIKLRHYGLESQTVQLNEAAARISRSAAGGDRYVMGSMGPSGEMLMMGMVSEEDLKEGFRLQAQGLIAGGVDALCIETMSAVDEAVLAIEAAREAGSLPVACTFTFARAANGEFRTMMGVSPEEMVAAVMAAGADIIGTNCGNGFANMIPIVKQIRAINPSIPVLVHGNAGKPEFVDGQTVFPETPEMMAAHVWELMDAGATIIGGCCGSTPDHIRAIAAKIRSR
jgi:5-methyltetrahydrofolate--homocysteine methyltransferase